MNKDPYEYTGEILRVRKDQDSQDSPATYRAIGRVGNKEFAIGEVRTGYAGLKVKLYKIRKEYRPHALNSLVERRSLITDKIAEQLILRQKGLEKLVSLPGSRDYEQSVRELINSYMSIPE